MILLMVRHVYLDNSATTPLDPEVLEAMLPFLREEYGNASSIHVLGQKARAGVEQARGNVAELIGADSREIVFTSGGTESNNMALRGVATGQCSRGKHIITTTIEHSAILRTCERLEAEGFEVSYVPVEAGGMVRLEELERAIRPETVLISVMHANNEIGVVQPIADIVELARRHGILVHTDAVQSAGKIPVRVDELGVDLLTLSGHKIHGPKGVGVLYVRRGVELIPLMFGGTHERGKRPGTENVPGIVGLGRACELAGRHLGSLDRNVRALRDRLERGILEAVPGCVVNGGGQPRAPHLTNISFRGVEGEGLLIALDFQSVAVSTGSACASGTVKPSHVLLALGCDPEVVRGAIRFSLSRMTAAEEIEFVLEIIPSTVQRLRQTSPVFHRA